MSNLSAPSVPTTVGVWDKRHCQLDGEVLIPHTATAAS